MRTLRVEWHDGEDFVEAEFRARLVICSHCRGEGRLADTVCPVCKAAGKVLEPDLPDTHPYWSWRREQELQRRQERYARLLEDLL